ncbi:ribosome maturation factor RimM [Ruania halotolerans]|uniref:ribosome maturation factor RimM n=1 Tax=Ruania halotolerans TaxID=2897773 RepID=UPI001E416A8B|nr:ribosome maturation factor RimM [Ruania halotolerans]UFU05209.1 ribosome maturation factor RimM [Ruania halotolerans]
MTEPVNDDAPDGGPRLVRIATVGAPHGLRGDVRVAVHTDDPQGRLAVGSRLSSEGPPARELVVAAVRRQQPHWYVRFDGVSDRAGAEALRGLELFAPASESEDDAWYPHELTGLRAERPDGSAIGIVEGIRHLPAHDVLVVREIAGARTLVPFVSAIVPTVDVSGARVVIDPPPGLLAADQVEDDQ